MLLPISKDIIFHHIRHIEHISSSVTYVSIVVNEMT